MAFDKAPQINIGTSSMDHERWARVLDPFMDQLRSFEFRGEPMDVRENIAFQGGASRRNSSTSASHSPGVPLP